MNDSGWRAVTAPEEAFRVRCVRFAELDAKTVAAWESLEQRALESNAYLSPRFVIPAMRHLSSSRAQKETMFAFVEKTSRGLVDLAGVGVFVPSLGTRRLPLPHLQAYRSPHSYVSGILVDRHEAEGAVRAFFRFFSANAASWHGVEFAERAREGPQAGLIAAVAEEFGATWHQHGITRRAIFVPSEGGEKYMQEHFTSLRAKKLRKMKRRLEARGDLRWRAVFGDEVDANSVEHFLEVEHMGWKQDQGTSLRSRPSHEAFFREMVDGFRKSGQFFFTELSLDAVVIASTSNLISGGAGFAFKIGWRPAYAKESPGVLNEVELIRHAPALCGDLAFIDSGAHEGSYIDHLWAGRRTLASGIFGTTALGRWVLSGVERVRGFKRWCGSLRDRGEGRTSSPQ